MTEKVRVEQFDILGEDERGKTARFSLPRQQADFIYLTRRAGSVSGNTYHLGKNPGTNPKVFVLLSGELAFSYRHIDEATHETITVSAPANIIVSPKVAHRVEAVTDIVILECNSIDNIRSDRHQADVIQEVTS
jgi:hypothetical protein